MNRDESVSIEEVPREECLALLASFTVGRIALALPDGAVIVLPVNYVLDGEVIVFRSDPGEKMSALHARPASFQIDWIDPFHRTGWSVLVRGKAFLVTDAEVAHLALEPWTGDKHHWVKVVPEAITGRRLRAADMPLDTRGYL